MHTIVCICSYKAICIIEIKTNTTNNLTNKGIALLIIGKYNEAIRLFDKVLATNPSDPKIMTDKGKALDDLGMHQGTIQYYDKALAIKPALQDAIDGKCLSLEALNKIQNK
jgi:tetratricopeptide (TPR) repeat protein